MAYLFGSHVKNINHQFSSFQFGTVKPLHRTFGLNLSKLRSFQKDNKQHSKREEDLENRFSTVFATSHRSHVSKEIGLGEHTKEAMIEKNEYLMLAALSASTHNPPQFEPSRQKVAQWITLVALASIFAFSFWAISRSETKARRMLESTEETSDFPADPITPEMAENFERVKATVMQTRNVERAVAALRTNDIVRCAVELELALEENTKSRESIEVDFFEDGVTNLLYNATLKVWLDGYPPDFGRLLQLRTMLHVSDKEAEQIESEIQRKSDVFVI